MRFSSPQSPGIQTAGTASGYTYVVATSGGDYTDLQSALNAIGSGKGRILVKKGTYTLNTAITFANPDIKVIGEGDGTVFNFNGGVVTTAFKMVDSTQRTGFTFSDFKIVDTAGGGIAFDLTKMALSVFDNITISGALGGFLANSTGTHYNRFYNCRVSCTGAGSYCFKFTNSSIHNQVYSPRCTAGTTTTGIIVDAQSITLYSPEVETNATVGIDVQSNGNNCTIIAPYLEGNVINLQIADAVEGTTIIGGQIIDGNTANIKNDSGINLSFENVWVGNSSYNPLTYHEVQKDLPKYRFINTLHGGGSIASTSQNNLAGDVYLMEIQIHESVFATGIEIINGAAVAGNIRVGIYGPITTEDTAAGAVLKVESASTAQTGTSAPQTISFSSSTLLRAGRYYLTYQSDTTGATSTHIRHGNTVQNNNWARQYARGGGYGAFTDPCPATAGVVSATSLKLICGPMVTVTTNA